ncbi:tudor domain-containing protein 15 isoform X2 [Anabas testudineus]|uniref:tudor domain-containing protein 15 isoform X2 n=1 Tax=Anabas testudineus TaxID=64144 RepID=UPI000E45E7BB|nr:tudor domain-containing protein 15 isoform X2 [Anabas testudineus]
MQSVLDSAHQKSQNSGPSAACALWPVDLKLTHLDWNPEATLIHFQGQYLTICELDYNILQGEIQNIQKTKSAVDIGEFCLVEDLSSARWYRGRVQNRKEDLFDVFLIDHGNVLSVGIDHISSCSNDLFILPPKIVCGFLANMLVFPDSSHSVVENYFSSLIGKNFTGYIQALLPHKILLLEAPDINNDFVRHGFGRYVDTDTFLFLVEMLTEVPLKQNIEPAPDLLIDKPRSQWFCFQPSGLRGYEDILSFSGPRLTCGMHVKVRVTAAVNSGLFYCQMASAETDLLEMSRKLGAVCEYRTKEHSQKETENLGLLCSVQGKDGKWYRGFVQFLPVNSQVRVLFIDYGYFESVSVDNVHRLPPDFYSAPIMAFPCSLSCLSGQDEAVRTQQLSFLKSGLLGGVLVVEISSFDEAQHLYSVTVFGAEDNPIKETEPIEEHPRMKLGSIIETEVSPQGGYSCYETIMGKELNKTLEVEEVQAGSVFVGYVEYVQNPNHFWIRTQKRNDEFEEMMTKIADHFSQVKPDEDVLLNPELGTLCCAVYEEDMHFYRGVITDILTHGAEVLFIDFGNIEKVPHMVIKKIPEEFASKSAFAFCCSLVNVFPSDEDWTSTAADFFRQAVSNKAFLVRVVQKRKKTFVVDLYEMESENSQSISELLISSKQAEYWNSPIGSVVQSNTHMSERTSICVTSDISGNAEQLEEENVCKNETEKAQASSLKALSIRPGCEFAVRCSYISSPSDFWCQPLDKGPALEELMNKVQQYYSTHTVPLKSGDLCCITKSPVDGKWYRAFIIEQQKDHARVVLVDYGFTIQIRKQSLQAIMPEYVDLEAQAFRCSLSKTCREWSLKACNILKDFVVKSTCGLKCKVISQLSVKNKGLCNVVDLYDTQTQQRITDMLVEHGLARKATAPTTLSTVFPESFVYSSYDLSPGKEEIVYVTHVSSQWEVYCHLDRNTEIIEELEKKISEESEKIMQASTRAVVRKLCLAKYFDGRWYRGLAHPVQSPLHLSVFFVDYGNTNISEKTHVMFIPRDSVDLLYTPMQAVRCSLASVSKEELYADAKECLDGAVLNKQVRVVIVGKNKDGSFDVQLFDGDVNINEKVNDFILSLSPKPNTGMSCSTSGTEAKHRNTSVKCKSQPKGRPSNPLYVRGTPPRMRENERNTNVHGNRNVRVTQQNRNRTKSCVSATLQKSCDVKEQRETQHPKEPGTPQLTCLPDRKLKAGFRAKCFTSHIDSIKSFFLQLSEDEPSILKMGEDLNSDVVIDSLKTPTLLRMGDLVLAEYEEDGALYRSAMKDYHDRSSLRVEFIDYGNCAAVGKKKIYSIPKDYLSQPRLSISCSLLESAYENDAAFTDAVMEKPLMVEFVHQNGNHWEVKVEIQDEVVLPAALEESVESSPVNENKEECLPSSTEIEKKVKSCDQRIEVCENEAAKCGRMMPAAEGENIKLEPQHTVTLSTTMKAKTCRYRKRTSMRNKIHLKNQKKTSVRVRRDLTDTFLAALIHAKDSENATVLSVETNGRFYIRLTKTSDFLAALQSRIADNLYRCETVGKQDVKQGLRCLAEVDNKWHRAVIQKVGRDKCHVFLVDHGITIETSSSSVRRQCCSTKEIPNLAVLCKVTFSEGEDAQRLWDETLKLMIGKEVKLVFVRYSETKNLWMVEIVMNGRFLVHQISDSLQQNQEIIQHSAETQSEAAEEDTSPPQQLVCAPVDIDKSYFGFAAAVTTPFEFCVVLEDLLLIMNKVSVMLDDLPVLMPPLPEAHLTPGSCCLLESDTQEKWCRAEVVGADASLVLNLVDYGHCEYLPYKDHSKLKRLPEALINLPKVTYPCTLRGVKPVGVDGQWTDEAVIFFQQRLCQKNLQIFFREFESDSRWKVDVLADGGHVAKDLVDAGHASYADVMLELRFKEESPQKPCSQDPERGEEEFDQEDEDSGWKSDLAPEVTEEAEGKLLLSSMSGSSSCLLM